MAPKRPCVASSANRNNCFTTAANAEHYKLIKKKGIVQERSVDFPEISFLPVMQETAEAYHWMDFNTMIGDCNISWVEEFYANALGHAEYDYRSTVRGVTISYTPEEIDAICGFREVEYCRASQRRHGAHTDEEYAEMLQTLALPGRDWHYDSNGEPIQIGDMIARSIKRMIAGPDTYIGHPFAITSLCRLREVPTYEDSDQITSPERPLDRRYFMRAVRDFEEAQAAAPQPPPPAQQEQHQVPHHIPQQHQYSDFELGMAATLY
ncbi:hypothetical protein A2U01_0009748, partial [Trifolium medium]|nr:hypothetical protein [Trifolium medium]